jgi:hypothetical protein
MPNIEAPYSREITEQQINAVKQRRARAPVVPQNPVVGKGPTRKPRSHFDGDGSVFGGEI